MTHDMPRIVVGGANSGVGKTSVTLALIVALRRRGLRVQPFKVGPDYLDPTYHALAAGRPCYNLDGWMTNREYVRELFNERASEADISVIEGVMGLFDGADTDTLSGSSGEIAAWLDAPVLLVVNVHGLARSLAALVKGYSEFDAAVRVAGVIANHCGSERHGHMLESVLISSDLPPLMGALPRDAFPPLPSRHLGLVTADRQTLTDTTIEALGDAADRYASIDRIVEIARDSPALPSSKRTVRAPVPKEPVRLGLAFDRAFHFYYHDNLQALERAGCRIVRFSPLDDESIPPDVDALYFGGGYPEEYAEGLSANTSMLDSVRGFVERGHVVYGECGGLMYLSNAIITTDGREHVMAGILPARTRMLPRLRSLGYAEVTLSASSLFGTTGTVLRGHEFHYSELDDDPTETDGWSTVYAVQPRRSDSPRCEGYQRGNVLVSYVHLHIASRPEVAEYVVNRIAEARDRT